MRFGVARVADTYIWRGERVKGIKWRKENDESERAVNLRTAVSFWGGGGFLRGRRDAIFLIKEGRGDHVLYVRMKCCCAVWEKRCAIDNEKSGWHRKEKGIWQVARECYESRGSEVRVFQADDGK